MRLFALSCVLMAVCASACGPGATTASPTPTDRIAGGATCPTAESLDLTFSGTVSGRITCSTAAVKCIRSAVNLRAKQGLSVPVNATVGTKAVQLVITFSDEPVPGSYPAGPPGEAGSSPQGVTLDGIGHWVSETGGSLGVSTDDAAGVSGTAAVQLQGGGAGTIKLSGTWHCTKPPDF
jgi:hypothetical protein